MRFLLVLALAGSAAAAIEVSTFRFGSQSAFVSGHIAISADPATEFAVLAPAGGCGSLSPPSETVAAAQADCEVTVNAGFFNTSSGACYGALVSDTIALQPPTHDNVAFGLRLDGSLSTGHIADGEEEDFSQLVSGVVWLVREGADYVQQSWDESDTHVQETGDEFVTVKSARTALGYDADGRVIIVQIDGKTGVSGVDLFEMARTMIELGAVNAVNLDGGGSAAFVRRGVVANFPSDDCAWDWEQAHGAPDPALDPLAAVAWANTTCERPVSSVVCLRASPAAEAAVFDVRTTALMAFVLAAAFAGGAVVMRLSYGAASGPVSLGEDEDGDEGNGEGECESAGLLEEDGEQGELEMVAL